MPHLSGVFDEFPDLEKASLEEIASRLNPKPEVHSLVNFFGNRVLYPQTVPLTPKEMFIDLAILASAVKLRPGLFYEPQSNKLIIPKRFLDRFPNLDSLIKTIIGGINPKGTHFISIKDQSSLKIVGSVISPINPQKLSNDNKFVIFRGLAIEKKFPLGVISVMPTPTKNATVNLGGEDFEIAGGEAGVFIDLRMGEFAS